MDSKELRGLMEAYSEVYAPQEVDEATAMAKRGYDEAPIRQKIAKSTGGGEAADRASALEKKSTFGDAKKAKARQDLARKQRGDFRKTTSSNPGLHGYAHKSDDAGVKAKQAARGAQRGALTPAEKKQFNREEFDTFDAILEFLYMEGFAETLEEAEWMMANMIDEEAIDIIIGEASRADDTTRANIARYAGKKGISFEPGPNWDPSANRGRGAHLNPKQKEKQRRKALRQEEFVGEAQEASNNPEKYEADQKKKSAPVRGEKTPMPPRGDKRREDFEKWYAKNVR